MVDPEEGYSLGQSVKESVRRGLRQIIVLSLFLGIIGAISATRYFAPEVPGHEDVGSNFFVGIVCGPPLWLLWKFVAFVFPRSWWQSLRSSPAIEEGLPDTPPIIRFPQATAAGMRAAIPVAIGIISMYAGVGGLIFWLVKDETIALVSLLLAIVFSWFIGWRLYHRQSH